MLLTRGDSCGAFATMVKHAGFAPGELAALPLGGVRLALLAGIRGREWQRTEALLDVNLAGQQAQHDTAGIAGYAEIELQTLLIGSSGSPPLVAARLDALRRSKQRPGARRICRLGHRHAAIRPDRLVRQEAALDALFTAPTIQGRDGHVPHAIRLDRTLEFLERWHVPVRARVSAD